MSEVQFADVAAQIDPTSVHLKSLTDPAGLRILEQNYEYDLLSAQKLLEKYVGKKVRLYQGNGSYLEATLLSTDGPVYEINGEIHMGHQGQVVFPSLPENLVSKPTLAVAAPERRDRAPAGRGVVPDRRHQLEGRLRGDPQRRRRPRRPHRVGDDRQQERRHLQGRGAQAGRRRREPGARGPHPRRRWRWRRSLGAAAPASRDFVSEGFFEYHLYTLDGRTTIKDKQTKQLTLMSAAGVPVRKELAFFGARDYYRSQYGTPMSNQKVSVFVELTNAKANNLGVPLPKGKVRVYKADKSGSQQLVGEDWIDHTPKDERVRIKMGEAFDVVGERTQRDWKKIGGSTYEVEWEISLRNHKKEDVVVSVIEPIPGDWEVLRETQAHEKLEAHTLRYQVPVPQEGSAKVTYRVRLRF